PRGASGVRSDRRVPVHSPRVHPASRRGEADLHGQRNTARTRAVLRGTWAGGPHARDTIRMTSTDPDRTTSRSHGAERAAAGIPLRLLEMDRKGRMASGDSAASLASELSHSGTTDLLVLAHGWNNEREAAASLYRAFLAECSVLLDQQRSERRGSRELVVGCAGILWPATRWLDSAVMPPTASSASDATVVRPAESSAVPAALPAAVPATGPVAFADGYPAPGSMEDTAASLFDAPDERSEVLALLELLDRRPESDAALADFMAGVRRLALDEVREGGAGELRPDEDALEGDVLFAPDWRELLERLATQESDVPDDGGAAAANPPVSNDTVTAMSETGNPFRRLWRGARGALRVLSYWTMKRRAGVVGQDGVGPLLGQLAALLPELRVHLIGHSFGARLVSYTLKGLPSAAVASASPVKSLLLLQGAFSHYAFSDALPHDPRRGGHLRGMNARVDGPLLATHSRHDSAVRYAYPLASLIARQDASVVRDPAERWGAMGDRGAQAVGALQLKLAEPGVHYPFQPGRWFNLDGDELIRRGSPPTGAHADVIHPHTAWAALHAAGLASGSGVKAG